MIVVQKIDRSQFKAPSGIAQLMNFDINVSGILCHLKRSQGQRGNVCFSPVCVVARAISPIATNIEYKFFSTVGKLLPRKMRQPSDQARIAAVGQPIYEDLRRHLGEDRVSYEPDARPCPTASEFAAVKVAASLASDPLWDMKTTQGCGYESSLSAHYVGISWALATALIDWALEYDASFENEDPDGRRLWTDREAERHRDSGMALARRLAREFAASGRGHVAVWFQSEDGPSVRIGG